MQWPEKLDIFCDIYGRRGLNFGTESLNEAEQPLCYIRPFQWEMNDGAFWSFFCNSTGSRIDQTLAALNRIGAKACASLLLQARRIYFQDRSIPLDAHDRCRLLKEINGDTNAEANRVADEYFRAGESLTDLLLAFAQANEKSLRLNDDEAATAVMLEGNWRQCTKCGDAWEQSLQENLARCPNCKALTVIRGTK